MPSFLPLLICVCTFFSGLMLNASPPMNENPDVDVVYTWVDSGDLLWQEQRARYARLQSGLSGDANAACRFRSRDELKYSLRSIVKFAPYVRKIFIVTNGQKPSWIKDDPKIVFISHAQIFRNLDHIPTFNSMAIESCLHRIPGLSEYYVYFNDDVFLGKKAVFKTFFNKEKKVRVFITDRPIVRDDPLHEYNTVGYQRAIRNTDELLCRTMSREVRYHLVHAPDSARKSYTQSIENSFSGIFNDVEGHRFRCKTDYALTNGLIPYALYYTNRAVLSKAKHRNVVLKGVAKSDYKMLKKTYKKKPLFFCIQDVQDKESPKTDKALRLFFEKYFPDPASWEK